MDILKLVTLQPLKGSRSQLTVLAGALLNIFVGMGWIELTPEQQKTITEFLVLVFAYFFCEKVSGEKK